MRKLDRKPIIFSEIWVRYLRKTICKNGNTEHKLWEERWIVETVFSCIKRRFGEYVHSVRLDNLIQEMMLKAPLYNKMISI
jgi:hypothetical protein